MEILGLKQNAVC